MEIDPANIRELISDLDEIERLRDEIADLRLALAEEAEGTPIPAAIP